MTVTYSKAVPRNDEKHVYVECYASTTPSSMPTVADIPGYENYDQIAVGSWLMVVDGGAIYIANESGEFIEQ